MKRARKRGVVGPLRVHHLQGDLAVQRQLAGQVDGAHTALAELLDDLVAAQGLGNVVVGFEIGVVVLALPGLILGVGLGALLGGRNGRFGILGGSIAFPDFSAVRFGTSLGGRRLPFAGGADRGVGVGFGYGELQGIGTADRFRGRHLGRTRGSGRNGLLRGWRRGTGRCCRCGILGSHGFVQRIAWGWFWGGSGLRGGFAGRRNFVRRDGFCERLGFWRQGVIGGDGLFEARLGGARCAGLAGAGRFAGFAPVAAGAGFVGAGLVGAGLAPAAAALSGAAVIAWPGLSGTVSTNARTHLGHFGV